MSTRDLEERVNELEQRVAALTEALIAVTTFRAVSASGTQYPEFDVILDGPGEVRSVLADAGLI